MRNGDLAKEALRYWTEMSAMRIADAEARAECIDELDVLGEYTSSPRLRGLCEAAVAGAQAREPACASSTASA